MAASTNSRAAALLWDESFAWGIMSYHALRAKGLAFGLVSASDIRAGALDGYAMLYVPGGWASNKMKALGDDGADAIRSFVRRGGAYFGICGGAGLATTGGLGLLGISRKPMKERVPSLSGPVVVGLKEHVIWGGAGTGRFQIWWPSQFVIDDGDMKVLAEFDRATDEAFSADLCVGDTGEGQWAAMQERYGINLDPARMRGTPLVVEGTYGSGRVLLSLLHLEQIDGPEGGAAIQSVWRYLGCGCNKAASGAAPAYRDGLGALSTVDDLHNFGLRNFLWFERAGLVQWRRGIRGLEYFTLRAMARELMRLGGNVEAALADGVAEFCGHAKELLMLERHALQRGEAITFSMALDSGITRLRSELFSGSKSHGGRFKELLDAMDARLLPLLAREHGRMQIG